MIDHLDHLVLTTRDKDACIHFYTVVLGMTLENFGEGRIALRFGAQKINVHEAGHAFSPHARLPTPGSLDLCFIATTTLEAAMAALAGHLVMIEEGPVARTGATGPIRSVYVRDPDGNLIEIAERAHA